MSSLLAGRIRRNKQGEAIGAWSVCSAHPLVIEATLALAARLGGVALIEATSNQVNQDGGYTGLRPADFHAQVLGPARALGLPPERIVLGGDHLGPNCWQRMPAAAAMERAEVLVAAYVSAGFRKIHLDCSMACAGDPPALDDAIVAARAARLCAVAEACWREAGGEPPLYVIGTEVPPPGGAREALDALAVTSPAAARATLAAHRAAFGRAGVGAAWDRVIGLVVQPGVEFDHHAVIGYRPEAAAGLSRSLDDQPGLVFEAHSTDYQSPEALARLVRDHFAILKVGPAATHALREALWALDTVEREWLGAAAASGLRETVLAAMRADPVHWRGHYHSEGAELERDLQCSLSDRIRYYWPRPEVVAAQARLAANLDGRWPPDALLAQHLPRQQAAVAAGRVQRSVRALLVDAIQESLLPYARACGDIHEVA